MVYTQKDIKHLELMQSLANAKLSPEKAAEGMRDRYSSLTVAKEMAFWHKNDYPEGSEQWKYWDKVYDILTGYGKKSKALSFDEKMLKLCDELRSQGFSKQADALESKFVNYKSAASSIYKTQKETGEDLLNSAHPGADPNVANGDLGDVENLVSKHKKIVDIVNKQPTGKYAKYINQCKIALGEGVDDLYLSTSDIFDQYVNLYNNIQTQLGESDGNLQFFNSVRDALNERKLYEFPQLENALISSTENYKEESSPGFFSGPEFETKWTNEILPMFDMLKSLAVKFSDNVKKIRAAEASHKKEEVISKYSPGQKSKDKRSLDLINYFKHYTDTINSWKNKVNTDPENSQEDKANANKWLDASSKELEDLFAAFNALGPEEQSEKAPAFTKALHDIVKDWQEFWKVWIGE